jgi:hypothetical protein
MQIDLLAEETHDRPSSMAESCEWNSKEQKVAADSPMAIVVSDCNT